MLISSIFHDYYDVGAKYGVDKTIVYDRKTLSVKGKFPPISKYNNSGQWEGAVLGFCGKFYPFLYLVAGMKIIRIIWTLEEALTTINFVKNRYSWYGDTRLTSETGVKKFFDRKYPELEEFFHKYRTPIFGFEPSSLIIRNDKALYRSLVINPKLKDIQFYKVKGPIEAYQEIAMFISGVIGMPEKEMIEVSDEVKAESKGHGGEYSFRKQPGKRGKNRWR